MNSPDDLSPDTPPLTSPPDAIETALSQASLQGPSADFDARMDALFAAAPTRAARTRVLLFGGSLLALAAALLLLLSVALRRPATVPEVAGSGNAPLTVFPVRPAPAAKQAPILPPGFHLSMIDDPSEIRPSPAQVVRRPVPRNLAKEHATDPVYLSRLAMIETLRRDPTSGINPKETP